MRAAARNAFLECSRSKLSTLLPGYPDSKAAIRGDSSASPPIPEQILSLIRITSQEVVSPSLRSPGRRVQRSRMVLGDLIGDVLRTLWSHKLRTFLTMFGIAWGIVSIVLMVAAGEGLRKGQEDQARTLGKDVMIVFHGRTSLQAGGTRGTSGALGRSGCGGSAGRRARLPIRHSGT